jgi:4-hydroxy-3-polyprenylbenzoate decarboxylase
MLDEAGTLARGGNQVDALCAPPPMAFDGIQDYAAALEKRGELRTISAEVDPELEIAEIADRVLRAGGPALRFERPKGHHYPVLINLFGNLERTAFAFGVSDLDEIGQRIAEVLRTQPPTSLLAAIRALPRLAEMASWAPRRVGHAPCQEVVESRPSLLDLPALKCWPGDGGRFLTLPMVITRHPKTGQRNVGMYRMQIFDEQTAGLHWHPHKVGAEHYRQHEAAGERMPVAVALGSDPAVIYAATAPLPEEFDELLFAGFLRRKSVETVRCRTVDLEVPADAEFVLEGYANPGERRREGPFGDHTGYYSLADDFPVFHLTCMTRRTEPVYPATIVGRPPKEDCFLGKATERIFLPLIRLQLPEIVDINLPVEGIFHNLALVRIRKRYPGHAYKVMHALWGMGQLMLTKIIVVVDEEVDVQDLSQVIWRVGSSIDPERDICFVRGPVDILDHAARLPGFGSKMGIDATRKWPGEGFARPWPEAIEMSPEVKARVDALWPELGLGGKGEET